MLLLLHLFSLFLLVLLGFYVFVADPRNRANQTFALFLSFLALWTVKDLVFWNFPSAGVSTPLWAASSFAISVMMQAALVVFAEVFPDDDKINYRKLAVVFAPGAVLVPTAFAGLLWKRVEVLNGEFQIELSFLAYVFVVYVYLVFGYGAWILVRKYRGALNPQRRQQIGAIIWALSVTVFLKTLANIALPFLGVYDLLPLSAVFVLPGVVIYAYAISNFRLFSIQTALDQFRLFPLTYKVALSIASVAIISFVAFQIPIVWWSFQDHSFEAWRRYLTFSLISALVPNLILLLLVVRTISRPLERITLAAVRVTEGSYGTEVEMRKSNDEIGVLASSFNEMSRKMAADIEAMKLLNEKLIRTEKLAAMGTLAAGVAHEVNNPLASISSLIQLLQSNQGLDGSARERLDLIASQIDRIKRVTQDMMEFGRVRPAARKPVSINRIIEDAVRFARFDGTFKTLEVTQSLDEGLPEVMADADQLQQVVFNLLLNARDAVEAGGGIRIASTFENDEAIVIVEDSGDGISDEDLGKIFDPFFSTKQSTSGTGLGLAVCYGIVTAHGGTIEVQRLDSHGTRFTVRLPIN